MKATTAYFRQDENTFLSMATLKSELLRRADARLRLPPFLAPLRRLRLTIRNPPLPLACPPPRSLPICSPCVVIPLPRPRRGLLEAGWDCMMSDVDVSWLDSPWRWIGTNGVKAIPEAARMAKARALPGR